MKNLSIKTVRPNPLDRSTVETIETDVVFDLMQELCNVLYEDGFSLTSSKLETALDAFLVETGKVIPRDRSRPKKRNPPEARQRQRALASGSKAAERHFSRENLVSLSAHRAEDKDDIDNIFSDLGQDNIREANAYRKQAAYSS